MRDHVNKNSLLTLCALGVLGGEINPFGEKRA